MLAGGGKGEMNAIKLATFPSPILHKKYSLGMGEEGEKRFAPHGQGKRQSGALNPEQP